MNRWNRDQKRSIAETLNNLVLGIVLTGLIQPIFSGVKDIISFIKISVPIMVMSGIILIISFKILER